MSAPVTTDLGFADAGQRLHWAKDAVMLAWRMVDGLTLPDTPEHLPGEPGLLMTMVIEDLSSLEIMLADAADMWQAWARQLAPPAAPGSSVSDEEGADDH